MICHHRFTACCSFFTICLVSLVVSPVSGADLDFNRDVRPILSNHCFGCHGPDEHGREADLRLDQHDAALSVIAPGDAVGSTLIERITSDDEYEVMPPPDSGKELSAEEIEILRRWIDQGATWADHWAYVPPKASAVPKMEADDWSRTDIDRFILKRLKDEGFEPSPRADMRTLARRLSFDLTGLPLEPQRVSAMIQNGDQDRSVERLVDDLLESPHFGERMAMYWLDLVRYADTVGYHGDQDHNIAPYRDYVIQAFNQNLPFDQFTREQLAGDLLPDPTVDQMVATGYNRLLQTTHEGGLQPKEYEAIYAADRVRNVSGVWLGGTLGCAQCHDHKYDPYTATDFYSMATFFSDVDDQEHFKVGTNSLPTKRPPEIEVLSRTDRAALAELEAELKSLGHPDQVSAENEQRVEELVAAQQKLESRRQRTMITVALKQPRETRVLPRGNFLDESGPVVQPAVPEFLGSLQVDGRANRLDLADWLTDADQGAGLLTARVMVNRIWYLLMGQGLSVSLDDFGGQGEPPTHPELLDYLAIQFVESGWDVKHIVRMIVGSKTYRQSSEWTEELQKRDPENRWFARQSRFRLPAETVRDTALAVSGLLIDEVGGPSVKPYQPQGYYRHLNFPQRRYSSHADQRQWRRGVYVHWQRQFLHPMLKAFDAPSREECTARRPSSNTPLAALVLLNDPSFVEAAEAMARGLLANEETDDSQRINQAFQQATSREPDSQEQRVLIELLEQSRDFYQNHPQDAERLLQIGERKFTSEHDVHELAAWTTVCRAVLNLAETTTRM